MADKLTEQMIVDFAKQFADIPAQFVVRNEPMVAVLRVLTEKIGTVATEPRPFSVFGIPLVTDSGVEPGVVEVRASDGRVLQAMRLFELAEMTEESTVITPRAVGGTDGD